MASLPVLGGSAGSLSRRLVHFHVPLALASGLLLFLFMTLPPFAPQGYPQLDMGSAGALPRKSGGSEAAPRHGRESAPNGHGGTQRASRAHGAEGAETRGHGDGRGAPPGHGEEQGATPDATRPSRYLAQRSTVATGYVATSLLAFTLLIGPANLLLGRRNPVSSFLRRDAGTWTAAYSVVHVVLGVQLHSRTVSDGFNYFVAPAGAPLTNSFGLGNWTGLAALLIVLGLLAISSDVALRKLKAKAWKRLQRLNYVLFALVVAHAFFHGALLRTSSPFTLLLGLLVLAVFVGQALGVWSWRRRFPRTAADGA